MWNVVLFAGRRRDEHLRISDAESRYCLQDVGRTSAYESLMRNVVLFAERRKEEYYNSGSLMQNLVLLVGRKKDEHLGISDTVYMLRSQDLGSTNTLGSLRQCTCYAYRT